MSDMQTTSPAKDIFDVAYTGYYSLTSGGFDAEGPFFDGNKPIGKHPLGKLMLEKHENVTSLLMNLERDKDLKIITERCLIDDKYFEEGFVPRYDMPVQINSMVLITCGRLEAIVAAAVQILYHLRDKDTRVAHGEAEDDCAHSESGALLGFCLDKPTNIKVKFTFAGKVVYVGAIEQCDGTGAAVFITTTD
eukprot:3611692-Prymnesium_polylepis.1